MGSGFNTLLNGLKVPGYSEVNVGDVHVELIPSALSVDAIYTDRKESSTKDKEGNVTKTVSHTAYVPAYLNATLRVLAQGGEVLHEEVFGPSEGAPKFSGNNTNPEPGLYEGEVLYSKSTVYRYDIKLDGSSKTASALQASIKKNWGRHLAAVRSEVCRKLNASVSTRLGEMGFRPWTVSFKVPTMKDGHPESDAFNASAKTLRTALSSLTPGKGVEAAQASAAPALAYFQELYDSSTGEDKQVVKLRSAAFENLVFGYAYLEEFDKTNALLANHSEKEMGKLKKKVYPLSRSVPESLEDLAIDSRYAATFKDAEPLKVAPAEADLVELYGLQSEEITDAARDDKIGLTEVEEEFSAKAFGGKGEAFVFNGVAAPRQVITKGDGAKGVSRFLNTLDVPAILGKNVRGYTVSGADDVKDIDFDRLTYDSIMIGNRTFVKKKIKLNMVQKSIIALPIWYEVVYSSPNVEVYQQAPTERQLRLDERFSDVSASYTVKLKDGKYQHTNSVQWSLTQVKSFAKHLNCPAVNDFVATSSPGGHYYTFQYMAQLYDENCAQ
ncbi:MAG: hypothetical protein AB8F78_15545 [Saprospiraceae bacterium]